MKEKGGGEKAGLWVFLSPFLPVPTLEGYLEPFIFLALRGRKKTSIYRAAAQSWLVVVRSYWISLVFQEILIECFYVPDTVLGSRGR